MLSSTSIEKTDTVIMVQDAEHFVPGTGMVSRQSIVPDCLLIRLLFIGALPLGSKYLFLSFQMRSPYIWAFSRWITFCESFTIIGFNRQSQTSKVVHIQVAAPYSTNLAFLRLRPE